MKNYTYWDIKPGQDTEGLYLGYSEKEPKGIYTHPLNVITAPQPFGETDIRGEDTRYFALDLDISPLRD